jgi:hypothetical protein
MDQSIEDLLAGLQAAQEQKSTARSNPFLANPPCRRVRDRVSHTICVAHFRSQALIAHVKESRQSTQMIKLFFNPEISHPQVQAARSPIKDSVWCYWVLIALRLAHASTGVSMLRKLSVQKDQGKGPHELKCVVWARYSQVKLSERNIVELVNKLKSRGLLDDVGLLHTVNGKEYITRDRVKGEVKAAVARAGGRIELVRIEKPHAASHLSFEERLSRH